MSTRTYQADDELSSLLKAAKASDGIVRIVAGSALYELRIERPSRHPIRSDPFQDYDAEAVRAALRETFGMFGDLDADAVIAELRAQRGQHGYDDGLDSEAR